MTLEGIYFLFVIYSHIFNKFFLKLITYKKKTIKIMSSCFCPAE